MNSSKVFFIDFHTHPQQNILIKLQKLLIGAGFDHLNLTKKMTALKIHFGEPGNMSFIRPNYATTIANMVKERGGIPFLTDENTLYKGRRSNGIDHLQSAYENGFSPLTTGCHVVIADGIYGKEYREIDINFKHCKTAKIGSAIADADVLISINHFKGHEMAGFGGALKNIGMGSGSIGGKLEMHSDSQPYIIRDNCTGCEVCVANCAHDSIHLDNENIATINYDTCTGCGQCIAVCQYGAPQAKFNAVNMQQKMMEYAFAVLKNKQAFHINFIMDVSPNCDCWGYNDIPLVPNIGIMASTDPVAIDRASADMVNKSSTIPGNVISKHEHSTSDKFRQVYPNIDWNVGLNYAEELGIGTQKYDLITL